MLQSGTSQLPIRAELNALNWHTSNRTPCSDLAHLHPQHWQNSMRQSGTSQSSPPARTQCSNLAHFQFPNACKTQCSNLARLKKKLNALSWHISTLNTGRTRCSNLGSLNPQHLQGLHAAIWLNFSIVAKLHALTWHTSNRTQCSKLAHLHLQHLQNSVLQSGKSQCSTLARAQCCNLAHVNSSVLAGLNALIWHISNRTQYPKLAHLHPQHWQKSMLKSWKSQS